MASNNKELSVIYKQISVLEIIEKIKLQGIVWAKVTPYQFRSEFAIGIDCWDIYLTRMPNTSTIILDFVKNLRPFYSINSDAESSVIDLYNEANTNDDYCRDKELLSDIQIAEGCGPRTFNIGIQPYGLFGNSGARWKHLYIPQDYIIYGLLADGGFYSHNNISNITMNGRLMASGLSTININYNISISSFGLLANGSQNGLVYYNISPNGGVFVGSEFGESGAEISSSGEEINEAVVLVYGNGGALVAVITSYSVAAFGVYAGGVSNNYKYSINNTSGGIYLEGLAICVVRYNCVVSGGGYTLGSAIDTVNYNNFISGGVYGSGIANNTEIYNSIVINGGVYGAGIADNSVDFINSINGGVYGDGTANNTEIYNSTVLNGGVYGDGTANNTEIYNSTIPNGGVYGAGIADNIEIYNSIAVNGGSYVASSSFMIVIYSTIVSGGVYVDGSSTINIVFKPSPSGGIYGNGLSIVVATYNYNTVSAGVVIAGEADNSVVSGGQGQGGEG